MGKMKTHQATAKRFKLSKPKAGKSRKYQKRRAGQDHYNSQESGSTKRRKRRDFTISAAEHKRLQQLIPYHQ